MWEGPHIHLSNITLDYFGFFLPCKCLTRHTNTKPFVCTFPFPFSETPEINDHPQQALPTTCQHFRCVSLCYIWYVFCICIFIYLFFYTLHVRIKARTKTLPTCIWADTVLQTQEGDKDVNWLFFFSMVTSSKPAHTHATPQTPPHPHPTCLPIPPSPPLLLQLLTNEWEKGGGGVPGGSRCL